MRRYVDEASREGFELVFKDDELGVVRSIVEASPSR
jgi:hypothetical protein